MKYRKFGKLDWKVSALGFGAMRLPVLNNDFGKVDEPEAIRMMRYAFDHGVNYVDSAYGYHHGNSDIVIGKALQDGYREKVRIATKLPCHEVNSSEDFDRCLNEQLKRLQTDSIDFYLLHRLNKLIWPKMRDLGVLKWADGAIADGRITVFPEQVGRIWANAPVPRTPVEWAVRWVWNHPEVTTVLSGMSTMQQVIENVATAERSEPYNLTADELALIGRVRNAYRALSPVACTGCRYCVPCPNGVDIPRIFEFYNEAMIFNDAARRRKMYSDLNVIKEEQRADRCIKCEQCVEKCPQKVTIPEQLEKAHAFLTAKD